MEYVVGPAEALPAGSKRMISVDGLEIGVFNVRGTYYALPNHCLHQGGPLCEGSIGGTIIATPDSQWKPEWIQEGEILVCPWHGLEFDMTTGRCMAQRRVRLRRYPVRVTDGVITVVI